MTSRYLFIHVMKTGGTSLVLHLLKEFEPRAVYPDATLDRRSPDDVAPYASLSDLAALSPSAGPRSACTPATSRIVARDLIGPDVRDVHVAAGAGRANGVGAEALQAAARSVPRSHARRDLRRPGGVPRSSSRTIRRRCSRSRPPTARTRSRARSSFDEIRDRLDVPGTPHVGGRATRSCPTRSPSTTRAWRTRRRTSPRSTSSGATSDFHDVRRRPPSPVRVVERRDRRPTARERELRAVGGERRTARPYRRRQSIRSSSSTSTLGS